MLRRAGKKIGLALLFLLIPYVFVLALGRPGEEAAAEFSASGRQIILPGGGHQAVDLEQFVLYMAAAQIPADYGPESLKCQAVIARTYLYHEMGEAREAAAADLKAAYLDETGMQKAWGKDYSENRGRFEAAVRATQGQTLRYDGETILPVFHRISAGRTRSGGKVFPYLKEMDSPEDIRAEGYLTAVTYTRAEAAERLRKGSGKSARPDPDRLLSQMQIVKRDPAGYVEQVQIGAALYSGDETAAMFGLPSPCFSWDETEGDLRILCKGQGHGYGLSQWGAREKEKNGYTYREILHFYFPGTEIP